MQDEAAFSGVMRGWVLKMGTTAEAGKIKSGETAVEQLHPAVYDSLHECPTVHSFLQIRCGCCARGLNISLTGI
jgi:hypothetical protein